MRRFGQLETFDEHPIPELSSEALDFRAAWHIGNLSNTLYHNPIGPSDVIHASVAPARAQT